jgi:hypothetical protein
MNKNKLNKFALQIAEDLMTARPSIPLGTAIGVANYKLANICSQLRIQIDTKSGFGKTPANIYQLLLLNSGGGKGASLSLVDNFYFKEAFAYIDEIVYPKFKEKAMQVLETEENDRPLHNWTKSLSNSTTSGLFAYAETYALCKIGGINIEVDEIGVAVTSKAELFEILLQPYDNGVFDPIAKRTDANAMTVKGLSVNLYCFGNRERLFEGDHVESSFLKLLDEGYGRRMIFIDDKSIPQRTTPEDIVREMDKSDEIVEKRAKDREFIKSLVTTSNLDKTLTLSNDARLIWATIKADGDNFILDNKGLPPAVKADRAERNFKVSKLAGIYAFFEGSDVITARHMTEALEVMEESSKVLADLREVKPLHTRLLDKMLEEDKPFTSQHLLSYSFIPSTWSKKILEVIDLSKQQASELGYLWKEVSKKSVVYYSVAKRDEKTEEILKEVDQAEEIEAEKLNDEQEELLKLLYD